MIEFTSETWACSFLFGKVTDNFFNNYGFIQIDFLFDLVLILVNCIFEGICSLHLEFIMMAWLLYIFFIIFMSIWSVVLTSFPLLLLAISILFFLDLPVFSWYHLFLVNFLYFFPINLICAILFIVYFYLFRVYFAFLFLTF